MNPASDTSRDADTDLLRRAADGDARAWEELVARYEPRLQARADEGEPLATELDAALR